MGFASITPKHNTHPLIQDELTLLQYSSTYPDVNTMATQIAEQKTHSGLLDLLGQLLCDHKPMFKSLIPDAWLTQLRDQASCHATLYQAMQPYWPANCLIPPRVVISESRASAISIAMNSMNKPLDHSDSNNKELRHCIEMSMMVTTNDNSYTNIVMTMQQKTPHSKK